MANASYIQTSFGSGEWSPTMQGRMDRPDYRQAMAVCLNSLPIESEAWTRRPGMLLGGFTRKGLRGKLARFEFKESSPYQMEFTDGHLRFWSGLGLVTTNDDKIVSSISSAIPAIVTTTFGHGWTTGDQIFFPVLVNPDGQLLNRVFAITVTDVNMFSLADAVTGANLDGSLLSGFAGGTVSRVLDIPTSYLTGAWQTLRVVQTQKQAVLLSGSAPKVLSLVSAPGPSIFATFGLAASNFKDGPYLDPYVGSVATPSGKVGNITLTLSFTAYDATVSYSIGDYASNGGHNYKSLQNANLNNTPASSPTFWVEVSGGNPISPSGFNSGDIGRHIRLFSEPALWAVGTAYTVTNVVAYNNVYWIALASSTGVAPGTDATKWAVISGVQYAIWSWGRITAVSGSGLISGSLAGSVNIGDMINGGGLAAAFDGTTSRSEAGCARGAANATVSGGVGTLNAYVGKNYTGASAQAIAQAIIYPSTDWGFVYNPAVDPATFSVTFNLRAKATVPASRSDGVLLGTSGPLANPTAGVAIASNDQITTWNYVWVEIIASAPTSPHQISLSAAAVTAQATFYAPNVANGSVVTVQIAGPPLLYTSAIRTWRAGVYSDAAGWPKCGTYHEGRLWLSGAVDNRFDSSVSNDVFNFAPTAPDGTVTDANGISDTLNAPSVNSIFWMASRQEGIVCGTQAGEWLVQATAQNQPLTPTNVQAHPYTKIKCANIEPVDCEHTLVFVQKHRRRMMEYFADVFSGKFASPNIMFKSKHLTSQGIAEIRYQQDDMPVVWMRMSDNSLSGLTYKRDSLVSKDGPTIAAAHSHTHGAGRTVESMAVGPDGNGGELEALTLITSDLTYRYVEVMGQPLDDNGNLSDVQCLDGAVTNAVYVAGVNSLKIYGLYPLNAIPVVITCGGLNCGTFTPINGAVTIPYGDGITQGTASGLFTQAFVTAFAGAMPIVAGYPYVSQAQLLRPNSPQESGARQGPAFGKVKRSHRVAASIVNAISGTLYFGTSFSKMMPALFKIKNGPKYDQGTLFTGIYKETLKDGGDPLDSMLCWQLSGPEPATIAAAGTFLDTEDE